MHASCSSVEETGKKVGTTVRGAIIALERIFGKQASVATGVHISSEMVIQTFGVVESIISNMHALSIEFSGFTQKTSNAWETARKKMANHDHARDEVHMSTTAKLRRLIPPSPIFHFIEPAKVDAK